jgi:hypothetical protein
VAGNVPAIAKRLQQAEHRRQELAQALEALGAPTARTHIDWRRVEDQARARLADWRGMLTRQVEHGRQLLRLLVQGPIRVEPLLERRGFRISGVASVGALLETVEYPNSKWRPHRDSNSLAVRFSGAGHNPRRAA